MARLARTICPRPLAVQSPLSVEAHACRHTREDHANCEDGNDEAAERVWVEEVGFDALGRFESRLIVGHGVQRRQAQRAQATVT